MDYHKAYDRRAGMPDWLVDLDLSVRAKGCLWREGVKDLETLRNMPDNHLLRFSNFGRKSLEEVRAVIGPAPATRVTDEAIDRSRKRVESLESQLEAAKARHAELEANR